MKKYHPATVVLALAAILAVSSALRSSQPGPGTAKNALPNGSFEDAANGLPAGWTKADWQARGEFALDETIAHSGKRSARISSSVGADASWQSVVPVLPFAKYRLSGWIKTQGLEADQSKGALLNLHTLDIMTPAVKGTRDWTRVEVVFETGLNDAVSVNCLFGGWGKAKGTAWFDDIALEFISAKPLKPRAIVEAGQPLAPISKYIYGQFIEHLGRCIYQGIWAEMLEDRKFYYPVGDKESPWHAVGSAENVRMNPVLPYVGKHAPEIRMKGDGSPSGLVQNDLALVAGRKYIGRIVLAADPGAVPVEVSLVWGDGPAERQTISLNALTTDYKTYPLAFTAGAGSDKARIEIVSRGREAFRVGTLSIMPADNIDGFRPEVIKVLKELNSPIYRWPGGNFVSGYDWKEGLGDPDRRPPRKNPAWRGVEHNDVGIHEFMRFCEIVGTEPYITVNSGQGNETMAADEVEYANGPEDSPMGKWRVQNGRRAPWGVRFWSIGNEMFGDWQLGHMPLADYTKKHNRFARAMRAKDPAIKLVGVGAVGEWSEGMLRDCAKAMDYMSEHFYVGSAPGLLGHVGQMPHEIKRIADAHRKYRETIPGLKEAGIPVALDEWNYWYGPDVYGEIGTQYFLKDALGIAAGLHEYFRNSDLYFMANYAQTVNVIGAIKTNKTAAVFDTTGLVLELYRNHYGTVPVKIGGAPEPLDVAAAWKDGRKVLTVAVVNPTKAAQTFPLTIRGASAAGQAKLYLITGKDELACNVPGREPGVTLVEKNGVPFGRTLTVPPMSVSLYEVSVR
jgi:alpha-N-arabinofuranosidase